MKIIRSLACLLLCLLGAQFIYAQNFSYNNAWKNIADLEAKNLPRSAWKVADSIYRQAKKDKQQGEIIKSLIYQLKYREQVEDSATQQNLKAVKNEIQSASFPAKNILQSMLAEMYWNYLQQNRYKIYNRTAVAGADEKDVTTWDATYFNKIISAVYHQSLTPENLLQQTAIDTLPEIILPGKNADHFRPSLYDLLANRALDYFENDEDDITRPAQEFMLNDSLAFAPAPIFAAYHFITTDTTSAAYQALLLLQNIIHFHLADNNPNALIDADMQRIQFVHEKSVLQNKDQLYEQALQILSNKYPDNKTAAQAASLLAQYYYDEGKKYDPLKDTSNQYKIRKAKNICDKIIQQFPKSAGGAHAKNLLQNILQPHIILQTEKVNVPGIPFRTLVSYQNADTIFFRIIKVDDDFIFPVYYSNEKPIWDKLLSRPVIMQWSVNFPDEKDFQLHRAEIKINALPPARYVLLACNDAAFNGKKNIFALQNFQVSNISYVENNQGEYWVLNRITGQPMQDVKVEAWKNIYDYKTRKNKDTLLANLITNRNGYFKIPKKKQDTYNVELKFYTTNDSLSSDGDEYIPAKKNEDDEDDEYDEDFPKIFLFTDRSIYRPGQTVCFKGIALRNDNKQQQWKIVPSYHTIVFLYDANDKTIDSIPLVTNQYGSYAGKFILPKNLLNGEFSIEDDNGEGTVDFSVEEYKRPTFLVSIQKPDSAYQLDDSVRISGHAASYAGANIIGGKVKYNVTRQMIIPFYYWREYLPRPSSPSKEIAQGEAVTDARGNFIIPFVAMPDKNIPEKDQPVFHYKIHADVTGINGETRSADYDLPIGYRPFTLSIEAPNQIAIDSVKNIRVITKDLSGIFKAEKIHFAVYQLQSPGVAYRDRYWQQPDEFIMSEDQYHQYFPYDIYKNENDPATWKRLQQIVSTDDSTQASGNVRFNSSSFTARWYEVSAFAVDKNNDTIKDIQYMQVYDNKADHFQQPFTFSFLPNKTSAQPGDKVQLHLGTSEKGGYVLLNETNAKNKSTNQIISLSGAIKNINIPVNKNDEGGIKLSAMMIKHNRTYTGGIIINVPRLDKELKITYSTFRDKVLPGAQEDWQLKISDAAGEAAQAEVLASMYDASLDAFREHSWPSLSDLYPTINQSGYWDAKNNFSMITSQEFNNENKTFACYEKEYPQLNWFGYPLATTKLVITSMSNMLTGKVAGISVEDKIYGARAASLNEMVVVGYGEEKKKSIQAPIPISTPANISFRKNFNETAFFFPQLHTDKNGDVLLSFTMPEALTTWRLMTLAHTKDLAFAYDEKKVITQKQLMVTPGVPRFLREGDQIILTAKIDNLSEQNLHGKITLQLLDALDNKPVNDSFSNSLSDQSFSVNAGQSSVINFPLQVPENFHDPLIYRVIADAGKYSDGEENVLPVLSKRILVTETLPMNLSSAGTKNFHFDKLLNSKNSSTLQQYGLTVEFTTNPAWYAVQALPYLMEFPHECAEQVFNRYYANALATHILQSSPLMRQTINQWKNLDTTALRSNLQKNENLKSVLLDATPWVKDAENETAQKHHLAILMDSITMQAAIAKAINQLKQFQTPNGGFMWFSGMRDDQYITQYILSGIMHLQQLGVAQDTTLENIINKALPYIDSKLEDDYNILLQQKIKLQGDHLDAITIQYLYLRSFFNNVPIAKNSLVAYAYYLSQAKKFWADKSPYMQGMIAIALNRNGDKSIAENIIRSLKETASYADEMGMYWKNLSGGYYWYQSPTEAQSLLIAAFTEITKDTASINKMKTWLLKQKQTQNWPTTKSTADACYALLLQGNNWLSQQAEVKIKLGNQTINSANEKTEAGTGYFQKRFSGAEVKPAMGNITVNFSASNKNQQAWGSVYWQYFEDLDKITNAASPLSLEKNLFKEINTNHGAELIPISDTSVLHVGDKIISRMIIRSDRDLEYVHVKDLRSSCMEPTQVLSGYHWKNGAGYYQETKDASMNFFFDRLPKGTYILEYPVVLTSKGNFSNGIGTVQCMYAPEFSAHSGGERMVVK